VFIRLIKSAWTDNVRAQCRTNSSDGNEPIKITIIKIKRQRINMKKSLLALAIVGASSIVACSDQTAAHLVLI
jgi:hypothetical protein